MAQLLRKHIEFRDSPLLRHRQGYWLARAFNGPSASPGYAETKGSTGWGAGVFACHQLKGRRFKP